MRMHPRTTTNYFKNQILLRQFSRLVYFKRLIFAINFSNKNRLPVQTIANLIADELIRTYKKHKGTIQTLNKLFALLCPTYIKGFRIVLSGKLIGRSTDLRRKTLILRNKFYKEMPVQTIDTRIAYAIGIARTYTGVFGVKIWLFY